MAARWPIVVGITVILGGFAWFGLRGDRGRDASGVRANPVPESTNPVRETTPGALRAPAGPELAVGSAGGSDGETPRPELPAMSDAQAPVAAGEFGAQVRDPEWAPATETEIKKRFKSLRGAHLEDLQCRTDQCMIIVAGTEKEVGKTISELEGPRGLHGFAKNVVLTAPETRDGKMTLRAFAVFER